MDEGNKWEIVWYMTGQDAYDGREAWREPFSGTREEAEKYAAQQIRQLGYYSCELARAEKSR